MIQTIHHLDNVNEAIINRVPPGMLKQTHHLQFYIKPALPTPATAELLAANAKNWMHTNLQILQIHYEDTLSRIQTDLHKIPTRNWQEPFQKAKTWAYRNFRKIKQTTFQTAFLIAQENLEPLQATQQPQQSLSNNSFAVLADNEHLPQRPLPKRPNKPHTSNVTTYISEENQDLNQPITTKQQTEEPLRPSNRNK
ncbi:UNVERIFIED_CONTAM: hypothetical protein FKN15_005532 [Acipenser sinensis]